MTTATTNTVVSNAASVNFQAWVTEMIQQLLAVGLTQTADTGQMANPCVSALPGTTSTAAGYYIFAFNDTLQATSPVYIKLECGTGSATTHPWMVMTVGTGTNGAGTITGVSMARCAIVDDQNPASTVTNYISRWCYNATQGFLGLTWKMGSISAAYIAMGGFVLYRSVNNSGSTTGDSVHLMTNANNTSGGSGNLGTLQIINYDLQSTATGAAPITNANAWAAIPFSATATLQGSSMQCFPCWQYVGTASLSGYGITNAYALAVLAEIGLGTTITCTILGSTPLTYISVGSLMGAASQLTSTGYPVSTYTVLMLWQ